jgi:hypothetical protein
VGDWSKVNFCHDVWYGDQPLKISYPILFSIATLQGYMGDGSDAVLKWKYSL